MALHLLHTMIDPPLRSGKSLYRFRLIVIYKCFQEDLMEGVIREEDREDREANKEDDIEYQIGLLGLVPPSGGDLEE